SPSGSARSTSALSSSPKNTERQEHRSREGERLGAVPAHRKLRTHRLRDERQDGEGTPQSSRRPPAPRRAAWRPWRRGGRDATEGPHPEVVLLLHPGPAPGRDDG